MKASFTFSTAEYEGNIVEIKHSPEISTTSYLVLGVLGKDKTVELPSDHEAFRYARKGMKVQAHYINNKLAGITLAESTL